jgi:hypothetical protein
MAHRVDPMDPHLDRLTLLEDVLYAIDRLALQHGNVDQAFVLKPDVDERAKQLEPGDLPR